MMPCAQRMNLFVGAHDIPYDFPGSCFPCSAFEGWLVVAGLHRRPLAWCPSIGLLHIQVCTQPFYGLALQLKLTRHPQAACLLQRSIVQSTAECNVSLANLKHELQVPAPKLQLGSQTLAGSCRLRHLYMTMSSSDTHQID